MKKLTPIAKDYRIILEDILNGFNSRQSIKFSQSTIDHLANSYEEYNNKLQSETLYTLLPTAPFGTVTLDDLKSLYDSGISRKESSSRYVYDSIMRISGNNKCPVCGYNLRSEIEHHLPKSQYAMYSVLPLNLYPICKDCNFIKRHYYGTSETEEMYHPYFTELIDFKGKYDAAISFPNGEVVISFRVSSDIAVGSKEYIRLNTHLKRYNLMKRFSEFVCAELSEMKDKITLMYQITDKHQVKQYLYREYLFYEESSDLYWKIAMYKILYESEDFHNWIFV